ncbi:MAG: chromosomal replication initiator protein DnaA [Kiritimatiellaeota bacterium]|nr:chromosomal replication initiator protein DnaA [Kiritimatiellota bacterium]
MRKLLNEGAFNQWITPVVPLSLNDGELRLGVSDELFQAWLQDNFGEMIKTAANAFTDKDVNVVYETGHMREDEAIEAPSRSTSNPKKRDRGNSSTKRKNKNLSIRHTFADFVVGPENEFAVAAAMSILKSDAPNHANPLFIYGGTGLGKTHILQAVANEAIALDQDTVVEYISCEEFLNLYIDSMLTKNHARFRNRFRKADYLLIDDIHFISKKPGLQEEFFNTFNKLHGDDKKILLTSDRRPSEINHLEDRLVSRFDSGLTVDIQPPGIETRLAVLRKKQETQLVKFDDETLFCIASNIRSNVRRLEGALARLLTHVSIKGGSLTLDDAERILAPMIEDESATPITIETIQKRVAEHFDVRVSDLTGPKRPRNIAVPRMMAMYFSRRMTDKSLPEIGVCFGRTHATVLHAVNTIGKKKSQDPGIKTTLSILERKLENEPKTN